MEDRTERYWTGDVPERDHFGYPIKEAFIDGRTKQGQWAFMTPANWRAHGVGKLGTGFGQRYHKNAFGKWIKVEG